MTREDKDGRTFSITTSVGNATEVVRSIFNKSTQSWVHYSNDDYKTVQYNPIRIKLYKKSGLCHMTINS